MIEHNCHALELNLAHGWYARAVGWLSKREIQPCEALWLKPCAAIHTFGMRFALGVFFLDAQDRVIKVVPRLKPFSFAFCFRASSVIETAAFHPQDAVVMVRRLEQALVRLQTPETQRRSLDKSYSTRRRRQ